MLKPSYKISIGSETFEHSSQSPVRSIKVNSNMDIPADSFELLLGLTDSSLKIKEGDKTSIELGYEDNLNEVINGTVDNVVPEIKYIRVKGLNNMIKLLEERLNKVYEKQTSGKIVSDLASTVGIQVMSASDGINLPYYVIDDSRSCYDHIKELAFFNGFDVYLTSENKLVYEKYTKKGEHTVEYGVDIINAEFDEDRPMIEGITVQGESPSSFKGADTSHWLTKRTVDGATGTGGIVIKNPALKDKDTAKKVATAVMDFMKRNFNGFITTVGKPEIQLGDTLVIKGMKNSKWNGEFQVRSVEHILNKTEGFTTIVGWRK